MNRVKKVIAFVVAWCLCMTCMPLTNVAAATEASVTVNTTVSKSSIYTDETVKVSLSVKGVPGTTDVVPTDVVLILDQSGSMDGTKIEALKTAAVNFINKVDYDHHRVGLISYGSDVTNNISFTTDKDTLVNTVNSITANGGTYIGTAINAANSMMTNNQREGAKPVIVIVTDGQASDESAARSAAETAKKKGFIFYTIALFENAANANVVGTTEYNSNELLKSMATTAIHHHFVGETGLAQAYSDIAGDIGVANPYNVKITQTISDEFEYVAGSADDNIPKPTVSGNTLTWEMLELKDQTLKLSYEIRPKAGCTLGTYPVTSVGKVEFDDFSGTLKTIDITPKNVSIAGVPKIMDPVMTPTTAEVGTVCTVKISSSATIAYRDDFCVTFGGEVVELTAQNGTYLKFKTPEGMTAGDYVVKVTNAGETNEIGVFTFTEPEPEPPMVVQKMTPTTAEVGTICSVKVVATDTINYQDDFKIMFGIYEVTPTAKNGTYFKFKTPEGLSAGDYEVLITNNGTTVRAGTFTYTEPAPEPPMQVSSMTPATAEIGNVATVKVITTDTINYQNDFKIMFGTYEVMPTAKNGTYFKFKTPEGLAKGEYEVLITNGGTTVSAGIFTYTEPAPEPPLQIKEMTPATAEVGDVVTVKVTTTDTIEYQSDFKIMFGTHEVTATAKNGTYFKFKTPTGLSAGDYQVVVTNGYTDTQVGTFTYTEGTPEPPISMTMTTTSGNSGVINTVKVVFDANFDYKDDFKVTLDGVEMAIASRTGLYVKFRIPADVAAGEYPVEITNGGTTTWVGTYTLN